MQRHIVFAAAILAALAVAPAATAGTLDLNINLASYHTRAWARHGPYKLNQVNPGLGLTYHFTRTWGLMGGEYKNSYRRPTWYAAAAWTPLQLGGANRWRLDAGVAAGLASGYTRRENPASPLMAAGIVRLVAPNGVGANLMIVPNQPQGGTGFIGLQVSVPLRF